MIHNQGFIEVAPAYGRDYKNQAQVKADWNAGMDFQDLLTRSYINKQDAKALGVEVIIRYANYMKVLAV